MSAGAVHYWYAWSIEEAIVIYDFRIIRICPVAINVVIRHGSGVVVVLDVGQYKTNGGIGIDIVSEGPRAVCQVSDWCLRSWSNRCQGFNSINMEAQ